MYNYWGGGGDKSSSPPCALLPELSMLEKWPKRVLLKCISCQDDEWRWGDAWHGPQCCPKLSWAEWAVGFLCLCTLHGGCDPAHWLGCLSLQFLRWWPEHPTSRTFSHSRPVTTGSRFILPPTNFGFPSRFEPRRLREVFMRYHG